MDLTHDWRVLNEVLFCQKDLAKHRPTLVTLVDERSPEILDGVLSTGEAFADQGAKLSELDALAGKYQVEQTVSIAKREIDQVAADAAAMGTNYYQQLELVRAKLLKQVNKPGQLHISREHFILKFFSGRAAFFLPRRFNVLVFLDQRPSFTSSLTAFDHRAILLSFNRGKLDQFFEPDFSSIHEMRLHDWLTDPMAIGKYLESRYILPCFGLFMLQADWDQCIAHPNPWSVFHTALNDGRAALYPKGGSLKALLAALRARNYFSGLRA